MFLIHIAQHPCNCFNHFFRFLFSPPLINSYLFIANLFLFHCGIFYICCSHAPQLAETINYYSYHCLFFLAYRHNHNLCLSAIYFHTTFYRIQIYHSFGKTEMSSGCSWCPIGFHSWSLLPILYRVTIAGVITAFEAAKLQLFLMSLIWNTVCSERRQFWRRWLWRLWWIQRKCTQCCWRT